MAGVASPPEPAPAPHLRADLVRELWETHRNLNHQIWFSHAKAAAMIGFAAALLGGLSVSAYKPLAVAAAPLTARHMAAIAAYLLLAACLTAGYWSMHRRRAPRGRNFVSIPGIAAFPSPEAFWEELLNESDTAIAQALARDIHERSLQVNDGYRWIVVAAWTGFFGCAIAAILLIFD
jgi:hypothetical protein